MPTTASGTGYTIRARTNAMGDPMQWAVADSAYAGSRKPVLLYCHGAGGDEAQFSTSGWTAMRDAVIDNGWVYVEALGMSETHWGHEAACESYALALTETAQLHPLGPVVILGQSMGGTVSSSLATQDRYGIKPHVAGLIQTSAVQSLIQYMVTDGKYSGGIPYYGNPTVDEAAWMAASAPYDPIRFDPADYTGLAVQWLAGDADTSVPMGPNAQAQYARVNSYCAHAEIHTRAGMVHAYPTAADMRGTLWPFAARAAGRSLEKVGLVLDGHELATAHYVRQPWRQVEPLTP